MNLLSKKKRKILIYVTGAIEPVLCPLGYKMYDDAAQTTFDDTCEPCRPGYYGNHVDRAECRVCRAGVVCKDRATTDRPLSNDSVWFGVNGTRSYPCPPGYYCPQNSSEPTPCPTGTYNRLEVRVNNGSKTYMCTCSRRNGRRSTDVMFFCSARR